MSKNPTKEFRDAIRTAIADYMWSEGCGCCRGDDHEAHEERIAKLLKIPKFPDGSGYDFSPFRSKKSPGASA